MPTGSTETYTVLARRFRPQGFAEVVGQEHISQALRNAILSNRVAHAYLFTGARGVGKTSTARILAKALNCPTAVNGDPCNACEICDGIAAGNDVDVLEIDGASNRGIDDIRQLRANVNVMSMRTKFKIYIIDEVHMLTKEAFNALLKTLEEPPPNVKFVFCTTEPNKLPDTILSRCQRFDFGTIETSSIRDRLASIAVSEGVEVDDEALELVARRAAGSMRDSQSIFDQLLAFGEEHVTSDDVHRLLGTASDDRLTQIAQALVERDQAGALVAFHAALDGGVQLGELTDQLLFYLRDLMVLAAGAGQIELLSVGPGSREVLAGQANKWGLQTIVAAMQILSDAKTRMQRVTYGRALAELALVRIAILEDLADIESLIEQLKSGASAVESSGSASGSEKKNEPLRRDDPGLRASQAQTSAAEDVMVAPADANLARPAGSPHASESHAIAPTQDSTTTAVVEAECRETKPASDPANETVGTPKVIAGRVEFSPENADQIWSDVVGEINDMLKSHVKAVARAAISAPNKLELTFPRGYHFSKRYCEKPEAIARLEQIVARLTGQDVRVSLTLSDEGPAAQASATDTDAASSSRKRKYKPEEDEFVSSVMSTFSAQVVRVDEIAGSAEPSAGD
jgi:DNA polymerase-3 subunit gamma/tau